MSESENRLSKEFKPYLWVLIGAVVIIVFMIGLAVGRLYRKSSVGSEYDSYVDNKKESNYAQVDSKETLDSANSQEVIKVTVSLPSEDDSQGYVVTPKVSEKDTIVYKDVTKNVTAGEEVDVGRCAKEAQKNKVLDAYELSVAKIVGKRVYLFYQSKHLLGDEHFGDDYPVRIYSGYSRGGKCVLEEVAVLSQKVGMDSAYVNYNFLIPELFYLVQFKETKDLGIAFFAGIYGGGSSYSGEIFVIKHTAPGVKPRIKNVSVEVTPNTALVSYGGAGPSSCLVIVQANWEDLQNPQDKDRGIIWAIPFKSFESLNAVKIGETRGRYVIDSGNPAVLYDILSNEPEFKTKLAQVGCK